MKPFLAPRWAKRCALLLAAALGLAPAARSTWSIIAVDTRTGEVCIAAATCLDLDLTVYLPVARVGVGGACAQSSIDGNGHNRLVIWNGMIAGLTAQQIMDSLLAEGPHSNRQYGIVTLAGEPVTFDGTAVGQARYGVAKTIEGVSYAIQGNVLAGYQVITDAENAFLTTPGDLGQRVMAAMEAARLFGGDGRCSCNAFQPTSCGCPPPSFLQADLTAFFLIARQGDVDGICNAGGCATGTYFCELNEIGPTGGDPVIRLQNELALFRANLAGRTDQLRTLVEPRYPTLPPDGQSQVQVLVELKDIEGAQVLDPAATITVVRTTPPPPAAKLRLLEQLGPGRFRLTFRATTMTGETRWRITSHQTGADVLVWPEIVVTVGP